MKRANDPKSLHSPFSVPGLEPLSEAAVLFTDAVTVARMGEAEGMKDCKEVVEEASMAIAEVGVACSAGATSSGNDIKKDDEGSDWTLQAVEESLWI